jgi:DNA-binding response OmpR family regulator
MRRILESAGYTVSHASRISEARQLAGEQKFDLVVSDVGLPDGTGLELMRELKDAYGLNGIALSGFGTDEDVNASKDAGFAEHLTKPVDWDRLRDAIGRLISANGKQPPANSGAAAGKS